MTRGAWYSCIVTTALVLSLAFAGCRQDTRPKIGFLLKTLENPFFVQMKEGIDTYVSENRLGDKYSISVKAGRREDDTETQLSLLSQWIWQDYDVVCITPASSKALNSKIAEAIEKGVEIVVVDTKLDEEDLARLKVPLPPYVGSNNYRGGQLAAEFILENSPDAKVKIVFFEGVADQETAQQRKTGFMDGLSKDNVKPIVQILANWNKEQAYEKMIVFLSKNIAFDAVFASNDQMALGVIDAMRSEGLAPGDKIIVGFDAIPEALRAIKDNQLRATVRQKPFYMGSKAMEIACAIIENKSYKRSNPIEVELIQK